MGVVVGGVAAVVLALRLLIDSKNYYALVFIYSISE